MKLKKGKLSRIIVAGLMVGSIGLYSNVSSAAEVVGQDGKVTLDYWMGGSETVENIAPKNGLDDAVERINDHDQQLTDLRTEVGQEVADRAQADKELGDRIDDHDQQLTDLRTEVGQEVADRAQADENLQGQITEQQAQLDEAKADRDSLRGEIGQEVADRAQADENLQGQITEQQTQINEAKADRDSIRGEISQEVADRAQADKVLSDTINNVSGNVDRLNSRVNSLEDRMGDVEDRIDKVGAMSAAIANLRTMGYDPEAPTEIAVGVGQYKSETGLALGIFHYPNQDFMLSASISTSGDEVMGGIGATWKIGRK